MADGAFKALWLISQNERAGTNKTLKEVLPTVTDIAGRETRTGSQMLGKYSLHSSSREKGVPQHSGKNSAINCPFNNGELRHFLGNSFLTFKLEIVLTTLVILVGLL